MNSCDAVRKRRKKRRERRARKELKKRKSSSSEGSDSDKKKNTKKAKDDKEKKETPEQKAKREQEEQEAKAKEVKKKIISDANKANLGGLSYQSSRYIHTSKNTTSQNHQQCPHLRDTYQANVFFLGVPTLLLIISI